jgi:hypothetical protein
MKIKRQGNTIMLNKKVSVSLFPSDMYIFSPADKTVYIAHNEGGSAVVTGYNAKGNAVGSYEYKNSKITRLFLRNGYANIVYRYVEPNDTMSWYQARLLTNGYCTEIYCLHFNENAVNPVIAAVPEQEATVVTDDAKEAEINEIIASVSLAKAEKNEPAPSPNPVFPADMEAVYDLLAKSEVPLTEPVTPVNPLLKPVPNGATVDDDDDIEDIEDIEDSETTE